MFVGTTGGALTVKVEDDTGGGAGVYSEPVEEPLQSSRTPTSCTRGSGR